ncbi:probable cytochrome P450 6a13 [Stomoxys calcitrans]|uniref:probable cytochrome P450 6a13 n=1 Tax=Stomoxys calcitrans TaxID=35570 RepID=UPI0027E281D4|nr:probable cytochrome P450 6a13 [Stomoxys calcitrans]
MLSWLGYILIVMSLMGAFLYHKFLYWQRKGVKTYRSHSIWGNFFQLQSIHHTNIVEELYKRFKGKEKMVGFYVFTRPVALILDLDLVRQILAKDFDHFSSRGSYHNDKDLLMSNIFFWEAERWRPLRNNMRTLFKPAKMRSMFNSVQKCAKNLIEAFDEALQLQENVHINKLSVLFTVDTITHCLFGLENSALRDQQNESGRIASTITARTNYCVIKQLLGLNYYGLLQALDMEVRLFGKEVELFFMGFLKQIFNDRERSGIKRHDMVDLLLEMRHNQGQPSMSNNEVIAQMFIFFLVSHESGAVAIAFVLYELAHHPHIQDKVREEILGVLKQHNNELSYEASMKLPYLEQVIAETNRRYPILNFLERTVTQDYRVENSNIVLEKGCTIYIPLQSIHYDPGFYESPQEFRPQHFHPSEAASRHPMAFLGFGEGPRNCIGMRMGQMQMILGLVALLSKFRFSVCEKTVQKFKISDHVFNTRVLDEIWLKVEKLEKL